MARPACITSYEALYARNYFAHQAGSTSFSAEHLPPILAERARACGNGLVDIGGGNGTLARLMGRFGVQGMTVDAADRQDDYYVRHNMAAWSAEDAQQLRGRIVATLGEHYFLTCFDVAEHIDLEHLPDFILNLATIIASQGLISISTRPSSAANRFHATILPIETWVALFEAAGFAVQVDPASQALRSDHRFSGSDANLVAVSHWQRANPFREAHDSHQHYLLIERNPETPVNAAAFREAVWDAVDVSYRMQKRLFLEGTEFPLLTYHVNFIQDWSFARSLMDVWPADRFRVTLRKDIVATPYAHMIEGLLSRYDVKHAVVGSAREAVAALDGWGGLRDSLVMTATEGLTSITHLMGSLMLLYARNHGARTLSMQHGMTVSRSFSPIGATLGAWDAGTQAEMHANAGDDAGYDVELVGSPKLLDAMLSGSPNALSLRFGSFVVGFERSILIGLNLHWGIHTNGAEATYQWLMRLCQRNPSTLFVLRPHPDDATIYERPGLLQLPNLLLADEMTLLSMDWPASRLVSAVDGVLTTYSTLMIDAAAAGKPVALLPSRAGAQDPAQFLKPSRPPSLGDGELCTLTDAEWASGALPRNLLDGSGGRIAPQDEAWFMPSLHSIHNIARIGQTPGRLGLDKAMAAIGRQFTMASFGLNLDVNPHPDRTRITSALDRYLAA